jgi:hypothetical protein
MLVNYYNLTSSGYRPFGDNVNANNKHIPDVNPIKEIIKKLFQNILGHKS